MPSYPALSSLSDERLYQVSGYSIKEECLVCLFYRLLTIDYRIL